MKFYQLFAVAATALLSVSAEAITREQAPKFHNIPAVVNNDFTQISLDDYKGKYVVLVFYPFDFTYVCPTELISFSDNIKKFQELGAEVLGVSTDSHFTHLAWIKTARENGGLGQINYPLLADITKEVSRDYDVLIEEEDDAMDGAALRGLFIIDGTQKLRHIQINDDAVGRSVDEALRLIQGFQWADKHGEVCPANWQPGEATIKPDQDKKLDFFKNATYKMSTMSTAPSPAKEVDPNLGTMQEPEWQKKYPEPVPRDKDHKNEYWMITLQPPRKIEKQKEGRNAEYYYKAMYPIGDPREGQVIANTMTADWERKSQYTIMGQQPSSLIPCWQKAFMAMNPGQQVLVNCPEEYIWGKGRDAPSAAIVPGHTNLMFHLWINRM